MEFTSKQIKSAISVVFSILKSRNYISVYNSKSKRRIIFLQQKENLKLASALRATGFFQFQSTNNGFMVGMSQLIHYIYKGYKAFLNGFTNQHGYMEVHHLDGSPNNNHPNNLVCIPVFLHRICTKLQFRLGVFNKFKSFELPIDNLDSQKYWNEYGQPITNVYLHTKHILTQTSISTLSTGRILKHYKHIAIERVEFILNQITSVVSSMGNLIKKTMNFVIPLNHHELQNQQMLTLSLQ